MTGKYGAHERSRTADLILTKDVLYRLSYMSTRTKLERAVGIEPTSSAWKAEVMAIIRCPRAIMVEGAGFEPAKLSRQIYSLIPLATREPLRAKSATRICKNFKLELADGIEPPTC